MRTRTSPGCGSSSSSRSNTTGTPARSMTAASISCTCPPACPVTPRGCANLASALPGVLQPRRDAVDRRTHDAPDAGRLGGSELGAPEAAEELHLDRRQGIHVRVAERDRPGERPVAREQALAAGDQEQEAHAA